MWSDACDHCRADHYGPAEQLIGQFLSESPSARDRVQVMTKACFFGRGDMRSAGDLKAVEEVRFFRNIGWSVLWVRGWGGRRDEVQAG